jgi:hypothetical protein
LILALAFLLAAAEPSVQTDGEAWNEGVEYYRAGDVTNALRVLRPLLLSRTHGARAAEVVAKLEFEKGDLEEAASAAQIALRAAPDDPKANRNFTRATDRLPALREEEHLKAVLKAAEGKDPGALLLAATKDCRALMAESGTYRTNRAEKAVVLADALSKRAEKLADAWIPVRELIVQSVTNEEQAATISVQIDAARKKTKASAQKLGDLDPEAYPLLSDAENDFTRFVKLTVMPPAAMDEDLVAQSNAWMDVDAFNGRGWQQDALDYTRAFRAKFPAWAKAYEQQAQSDTNKPPFTAEDQAKVSALATELEKLQIGCVDKSLPPDQEEALRIINEIRELLPKDKSGGGQSQQQQQKNDQQQNQQQQKQSEQQDQQNQDQQQDQQNQDQQQDQNDGQDEKDDQQKDDQEGEETPEDQEIEAVLKKAQERSDEHEAEKKARMRKAPLPPNERDW